VPLNVIDRRHLLIAAVGYASGLIAFAWLPGPYIDPEQSLVGRAVIFFFPRAVIAFLLPTAALVACLLADRLSGRVVFGEPQAASAKAVGVILLCTVLFMVVLHGLVLLSLTGFPIARFSPHRLVVVLTGLLFVGIGNALPRLGPNLVFGIRTRRLLENRLAWERVHRVTGHFLVALGVTTVGAGLTLSKSQIPIVLSAAVVAGATVNLTAYWRWTRG
jgi:uncharacterized membrane protein